MFCCHWYDVSLSSGINERISNLLCGLGFASGCSACRSFIPYPHSFSLYQQNKRALPLFLRSSLLSWSCDLFHVWGTVNSLSLWRGDALPTFNVISFDFDEELFSWHPLSLHWMCSHSLNIEYWTFIKYFTLNIWMSITQNDYDWNPSPTE